MLNYGTLPQFAPSLYGIKPAVLVVMLNAIWGLGKKAVKSRKLLIISILVAIVKFCCYLSEVIALLLGGLVGMIWLVVWWRLSN
jgi:chromate transporter